MDRKQKRRLERHVTLDLGTAESDEVLEEVTDKGSE